MWKLMLLNLKNDKLHILYSESKLPWDLLDIHLNWTIVSVIMIIKNVVIHLPNLIYMNTFSFTILIEIFLKYPIWPLPSTPSPEKIFNSLVMNVLIRYLIKTIFYRSCLSMHIYYFIISIYKFCLFSIFKRSELAQWSDEEWIKGYSRQ